MVKVSYHSIFSAECNKHYEVLGNTTAVSRLMSGEITFNAVLPYLDESLLVIVSFHTVIAGRPLRPCDMPWTKDNVRCYGKRTFAKTTM